MQRSQPDTTDTAHGEGGEGEPLENDDVIIVGQGLYTLLHDMRTGRDAADIQGAIIAVIGASSSGGMTLGVATTTHDSHDFFHRLQMRARTERRHIEYMLKTWFK